MLPSLRKTGGYKLKTAKQQLTLKDEELAFFMASINHKKLTISLLVMTLIDDCLDKTDHIHFL